MSQQRTGKELISQAHKLTEENPLNAFLEWPGAWRHATVGRPVQEKNGWDSHYTNVHQHPFNLGGVGFCSSYCVSDSPLSFALSAMQITDPYSKVFQPLLHLQDEQVFVSTNQNQPYTIKAFSLYQCTPQKYIEGSFNMHILSWYDQFFKKNPSNKTKCPINLKISV